MFMDAFSIAHWERPAGGSHQDILDAASQPGWLRFETCRRVLWISFEGADSFKSLLGFGLQVEIFEESSAYRFLLEVICGMHSPIFGETEILGQFREFIKKTSDNLDDDAALQFRAWSIVLLEDCKAIRHQFLRGVGQNSYGSVVRKWLRQTQEAAVLGTGQLAQEILPWVPKTTRFFSRDVVAARARIPSHEVSGLNEIEHLSTGTGIVIATPLSCSELNDIQVRHADRSFYWIDLRGERPFFKSHRNLQDLFEEQARQKTHAPDLQHRLQNELMRRTLKRWNHVCHRPYGWEDLTS